MNTLTGKSIGIALLLAAGLLAALFAMGVFAPTGVGAIKGTPKPTAELSSTTLDDDDVTLTVTFELNWDVNSTATRVTVVVPTGVATIADTFEIDNISVTQGGRNVGSIVSADGDTIDTAQTIVIGQPATGGRTVKRDVETKLVIEGLTLEATAYAGSGATGGTPGVTITQRTDETEAADIAIGPSVVEASVTLESTDDMVDSYDTGAPVTMELEFVADADGGSNQAAATDVVIVLPWDLDAGDDATAAAETNPHGTDDADVRIEVAPSSVTATLNDEGESITVFGFSEDRDVTITIKGLTNPMTSMKYEVTFRYGETTEAAKREFYITDMELVDVEEAMVDPNLAGSDEAVLTFEFGSILDLDTMNDSMIKIELDADFSLSSDSEIMVTQRQDRNGDPVDVDGNVMVDGNTITIMKDTADDAKNVMMTSPARGSRIGRNVGKVMVEITEVTNPSEAGVVKDAVTVTQGMFAPGMADLTVTGAATKGTFKADTAVALELDGITTDDDIDGGTNIQVKMPGFQVPASIDREHVIIDGNPDDESDRDGSYYGNPDSVAVSGSTITLRLPLRDDDDVRSLVEITKGAYRIFFLKEAGLKTPNAEGTNTITVSPDDSGLSRKYDITSHISAKPGWVERGDTVTVTAKGINSPGDATVHLLNMSNFDDVTVLDRYDATNDIEDIMELEDIVKEKLADETLDGEDLAVLPALDRSLRDGGTAVLDFDTSSSAFHAGAQDATGDTAATSAKGTNILVVVDAGGNVIGHTRLGLKPTVTLNLTEVRRTGRMGVTVSDWYYRDLSDLRVNGIQVRLPDPNDPDDSVAWSTQSPPTTTPLTVVVPRRARLGEMEVVVSGTTTVKQGTKSSLDKHTQTVNVGVFDLNITPKTDGQPTAVTDQVIRIEGAGFGESQCIVEITVGDEHIREATTGDEVRIANVSDCVRTDTDGTLSNSFKVPHNLEPGDYRVVARDALNRVGEGELTVPEPAITVTPAASQRGSTVTVVGENFPAEDVIGITYDGDPVTVATTDTVGKWRATFKVPVDATIGKKYEVEALSEKKGTGEPRPVTGQKTVKLSDKAPHTVPAETLKVWPQGQAEPPDDTTEVSAISSGGRLQVKSTNLPPHTKVSLFIGNIPVAGKVLGEDAAADSSGTYEDSVLVPQLTPGTHTVELDVDTVGTDVVVVTFVDILDIITRPTNVVFADLIAANQLVVVWHYDNATGTWSAYDPKVPAHINDLTLVSTGDIVWVEVTESVEFQGQTLRAGASLISLE